MRVSTPNVLALLSAATLAAASPVKVVPAAFLGPVTGSEVKVRSEIADRSNSEPLEKRSVLVAIATAAGTAAATAAGKAAVEAATKLIGQIANWDNAREEFTKATVQAMAENNPDPEKYVASVCYNMAYDLEYPDRMDGLMSVKFSLGPLHTDYDCFYMTKPNSLWTRGDGGFINLAIMHDNRCQFDRETADLWCP